MQFKSITKKISILLMVILIFVFTTGAWFTTDKKGRLRDSLENEHMYRHMPIGPLENMYKINKLKTLRESYKYIAFTGKIKSISYNKKEVVVFDSGEGIKVETSDANVVRIVGTLGVGDYVRVFGRIDSSKVYAERLLSNPEKNYTTQEDLYYPDVVIDATETITDLASDGHVTFEIPTTWMDEYVMGRLTNNNVNGYQFFLNAISPQNLNFPENFYIFYFNYEQYLDTPPVNPTEGDHEDLEEKVMNNVLQNLSGDFKYDIDDIDIQNGEELDYCQMVYKPADGRDYRLEFTFKPDNYGLVCMLYLYYPNDDTTNHIEEVSYVINSVKN